MRLGEWMVMLSVMIMFLSFIGVPTGLNPTISTLGINISSNSTMTNADVESSGFWGYLFGESAFTLFGVSFSKGILISLVGTGVIIIGLFAKGYDTSLIILPLVVFIAGLFVGTFWAIISYVSTFHQWWMTSIITLIFGGLAIGFIMSCVNYFAGR